MHWSVYDHQTSLRGIHLLWNTRTDQLIRLSEQELASFLRRELPEADGERLAQLTEGGFLTELQDEPELVMENLTLCRSLLRPRFRILLTTACNARCRYCYEQGAPVMHMTEDTARETADFILRRRAGKVRIEWFGGEPSLNPEAALLISKKLSESGADFTSSLVTNGLLPDSPFFALHEQLHLTHVQITLDGAGGDHERIKGVPEGGFARVMESVSRCLDAGLGVNVRIHPSAEPGVTGALIRELTGRFAHADKKPAFQVMPLYTDDEELPAAVMEQVLVVCDALAQHGLCDPSRLYRFPRHAGCFACTQEGWTIRPDGGLVCCSHRLDDACLTGSVRDEQPHSALREQFLSNGLHGKCAACIFLPVCGGGCAASAVLGLPMNRCFPRKNILTQLLFRRYQI